MSFESELSSVASEALSLFGKEHGAQLVLTHAGAQIPFYEEDETMRQDLVLGGLADATDKVVRVLKSRFPAGLPSQHQSVIISGQAWKVRSISGSGGDPEIRLTLIAPNRRS